MSLGEWTVAEARVTPVRAALVLRRLKAQTEALCDAYRLRCCERSHSEAAHGDLLRRWLCGWTIVHEPEAAVGLNGDLIVGTAKHGFGYGLSQAERDAVIDGGDPAH